VAAPFVHLSAIASEAGRPVPLAELDDPAVREAADFLAEEGIAGCRISDATPVALAAASGAGSLKAGETPDAVVCSARTARASRRRQR
jgi:hypothetical protein